MCGCLCIPKRGCTAGLTEMALGLISSQCRISTTRGLLDTGYTCCVPISCHNRARLPHRACTFHITGTYSHIHYADILPLSTVMTGKRLKLSTSSVRQQPPRTALLYTTIYYACCRIRVTSGLRIPGDSARRRQQRR
jgi:hypothetical protein